MIALGKFPFVRCSSHFASPLSVVMAPTTPHMDMDLDEAREYDFLLLLCADGLYGLQDVEHIIEAQELERLSAENGCSGERGVTDGNCGPLVGSKSKICDLEDDDGHEQLVKRHKVILPKRMKTNQWIMVSTSARTDPSPHMQF